MALKKQAINNGEDPLVTRKRADMEGVRTVDDLFADWYSNDIANRLKYPTIPKRLYTKDIAPHVGDIAIAEVSPRDIRAIIRRLPRVVALPLLMMF